jgi:hypothetical protein
MGALKERGSRGGEVEVPRWHGSLSPHRLALFTTPT